MNRLPSGETYSVFEPARRVLAAEGAPDGAGKLRVPVPLALMLYVTPVLVWVVAASLRLTAKPLMVAVPKEPAPSAVMEKKVLRVCAKLPFRNSMWPTR